MSTRNKQIKEAINSFDTKRAHDLIRFEVVHTHRAHDVCQHCLYDVPILRSLPHALEAKYPNQAHALFKVCCCSLASVEDGLMMS